MKKHCSHGLLLDFCITGAITMLYQEAISCQHQKSGHLHFKQRPSWKPLIIKLKSSLYSFCPRQIQDVHLDLLPCIPHHILIPKNAKLFFHLLKCEGHSSGATVCSSSSALNFRSSILTRRRRKEGCIPRTQMISLPCLTILSTPADWRLQIMKKHHNFFS